MFRFTSFLIVVCISVGLASAGASARAQPDADVGVVFTGNGDRTLPPVKVSVPSTLRWTSNGPAMQILAMDLLGGGVNSTARSGAAFLSPGTHRLAVNAWAAWTIRIVQGVERPQPLGGGLVGFRGNGARELPPFTTRRASSLVWTNGGSLFRLDSGGFSWSISSQAKRGKRPLTAGLHEFAINAIGSWTVGWKP